MVKHTWGLAYANLDLHRPDAALQQAKLAEKELGDSMALHLIRGNGLWRRGNDKTGGCGVPHRSEERTERRRTPSRSGHDALRIT